MNEMKDPEKTPWIKTPWRVLFEITRLPRVKPWEIDISSLVTSFVTELRRRGSLDFSAAGIALLSSSIIHRIKSERILEADRPPRPRPISTDYVPPPLPLPIRSQYTTTTITELVEALDKVLKDMLRPHEPRAVLPDAVDVKVEDFILKIEEEIDEVQKIVEKMLRDRREFPFNLLARGVGRLEAAKRFILLLFIASRGIIELHQEGDELVVRTPEAINVEQQAA